MKDEVEDPASRAELVEELRTTSAQGYYSAIDRVLQFTDGVYGFALFSWKAADRHSQIALLYPIVAGFLGWLFLGIGELKSVSYLADDPALSAGDVPGRGVAFGGHRVSR